MSRFILHTKAREKERLRYLMMGLAGLIAAAAVGYVVHSIGTARAKGRETVLIYTEEEFEQYLLDADSEEYNLNGRYQLEADLDLSWLETSIGSNIEPFTGSFDGNGHVISGLERPLFGVLREAEVEHLFLSESMIQNPFTYSDGEHYVDGYASLAAYAVDSSIKNCGMSGEIHTASPSEAEYQLAKATPADAEERKGPGFEEVAVPSFAEETMEAHQTESGESKANSGIETKSTEGGGPGVETLESTETETGPSEGGGPGSETGEITTAGNGGSTAPEGEESTADGNEGSITPGSEESGSDRNEESTTPGNEESTAGGNEGSITPGSEESGTDRSEESTIPGNEGSTTDGNEESIEAGNKGNTVSGSEISSDTETGGSTSDENGKKPVDGYERMPAETIGYQALDRHHLMLKIPAVTAADVETKQTASPSDATPFDAEEWVNDDNHSDAKSEMTVSIEEMEAAIEYIGNPNGDIYILVTAEHITAGGLVAETAGKTQIVESFALVTINSGVEEIDTFTGGMIGIVGTESRMENSYAAGLADANGVTGGFAADNKGGIQNCYSSMTIGKRGEVRGAFTATGDGILTGCVYDRQMACVEDDVVYAMMQEATVSDATAYSEFSLKGLNTKQMTGLKSEIPGEWHLVEGAYPQLSFFALSEQEITGASSNASAIALILPDEVTLEDVLKEGEIILPVEVDGREIVWEADGNVQITEDNRVVAEKITYSDHEVPKVQSFLEGEESVETEENAQSAETEEADQTVPAKETDKPDAESGKIQLKASVGTASRNFTLQSVALGDTAVADWSVVGAKVDASGQFPDGKGTKDEPYLIRTAEELAWFAYKVNAGNPDICARLENYIDLFGTSYNGDIEYAYDPVMKTDNIDSALLWIPIGRSVIYEGEFDGNGYYVEHVRVYETSKRNAGFVSYLAGAGVIKNLGVASGRLESTVVNVGGIVGRIYDRGKVFNCWNGATIVCMGEGMVAGIVGFTAHSNSSENGIVIEGCYNYGEIRGSYATAGILGQTWPGTTVRNCYNEGRVIGANDHVGGILGYMTAEKNDYNNPKPTEIFNCYNIGELAGASKIGGICGVYQKGGMSSDCYYLDTTQTDAQATKVTEEQLKSWAAAYALNGQSMTGAWKYKPGEYPKFGDLDRPDSWQDIGKGINHGLITGFSMTSGSSGYEIQSAEQLAAFAAKVNDGETGASAMLMSNLDLTGAKYSGTQENPVPWIPIGTGKTADSVTNIYTGTFDGNGKIIGGMKVQEDGYAGLFGCAGGGAVIKKTGLDTTCSIEALSPGTSGLDGTAAFVGAVRHTGTAATQLTIEHCYTRASIQGKSIHTGSFLGRDESTAGENRITNCYATGGITTSSGSVKPGAIAGTFVNGTGSAGTLMYCYWDEGVESHYSGGLTIAGQGSQTAADSGKQQASYMKTDPFLNKMNTGLSTAIWERDDSKNNGYPIFTGLTVYTSWEGVGAVAAEPATASAGTKGTESNPYLIKSAEDLAWFARQVNVNGNTGICGKLVADISLFGGLYTGGNGYDSNDNEILSRALLWVPAGSDTAGKQYTGTFDGNGHVISKMRVKGTEKQGLFGTLGTSADIRKTAVTTSLMEVDSAYAGGIAGYVNGTGVTVTECGNQGNLTGKGDFFGGVVGGIETGGSLVLDGCYNGAGGIIITRGVYTGGVLGGAGSGTVTIRNCYNHGKVEGQTYAGGIAGWIANNAQTIANSYNAGQITGTGGRFQSITGSNSGTGNITNCYYQTGCPADSYAKEVSEAGLKTWAAAYALNGHIRTQSTGISWTYDLSGTGYPVLTTESLPAPSSWEQVGEGLEYGLLDSGKTKPGGTGTAGDPYQISDAEQLAWVAYLVNRNNAANRGACVDLTADINLFGLQYTEFTGENTLSNIDQALSWMPMGEEGSSYCGTFNGNGHEIDGMYINGAGYLGLFGEIQYPANIQRLGIGANSKVTGTGNNCALLAGAVVLSGTGSIEVHDCYTLGTVESSGSYSGAFIGDDVGKTSQLSGTISNCYHAGSAKAFANLGAGKIENCYADITVNSNNAVCEKGSGNGVTGLTTDQMKTNIPVAGMNKQNDGSLKNGTDRVWYTSLDDEPLNGYPTFKAPATVAVEFVPDTPEAGSQVSLPGNLSVPDMKLRSFESVDSTFTPGSTVAAEDEFSQAAYTDITGADSYYHKYGYTNANQKLAFKAGGKDLLGLTGSLNNPTTDLGTVSSVSLGRAAAYTKPEDRYVLLEGASGTDRYEIQITVKGVTSKTLSVTMPVEVTMAQLTPDGTDHVDYSTALNIKNNNAYPIDGKIVSATPRSGNGYVPLKPVLGTLPKNREITDASGGVRLGLANQPGSSTPLAANIYYDPDAVASGKSWLQYRLKHGGILPYRYVMEYSGLHFSGAVDRFAYDISYGFAVSESNYTDTADVTVTP